MQHSVVERKIETYEVSLISITNYYHRHPSHDNYND